jgi:acid phosphatase (class A)
MPALAASTLVMPAWADEPIPYVTDKQIDLSVILPPPTVAGSQEDLVERNYALAVQKAAPPERIALANADAKESVFDMFTRTFGPSFSRANLPVASVFFGRVGESEDATTDPARSTSAAFAHSWPIPRSRRWCRHRKAVPTHPAIPLASQ